MFLLAPALITVFSIPIGRPGHVADELTIFELETSEQGVGCVPIGS